MLKLTENGGGIEKNKKRIQNFILYSIKNIILVNLS